MKNDTFVGKMLAFPRLFREHMSTVFAWRMIVSVSIVLFCAILYGGFVLRDWTSSETIISQMVKPLVPAINDDEMSKVRASIEGRDAVYAASLHAHPVVPSLSGPTSTSQEIPLAPQPVQSKTTRTSAPPMQYRLVGPASSQASSGVAVPPSAAEASTSPDAHLRNIGM